MPESTAVALIEELAAHPIVYQGKRCVTFDLVDQMHERPEGTTRVAFHRIKKRMKEGRHYYKLPVKELRELRMPDIRNLSGGGNPQQMAYLLNEHGYCMIVKVYDDDRAWAIQEELVDGYFRVREDPSLGMAAMVQQLVSSLQVAIGSIVERLERLETVSSQAIPYGPEFALAERFNQLLDIHDMRGVKSSWKEKKLRQLRGEATNLGIPLTQKREGGDIFMPLRFQPWAESYLMKGIRDYLESCKTPLFEELGDKRKPSVN